MESEQGNIEFERNKINYKIKVVERYPYKFGEGKKAIVDFYY